RGRQVQGWRALLQNDARAQWAEIHDDVRGKAARRHDQGKGEVGAERQDSIARLGSRTGQGLASGQRNPEKDAAAGLVARRPPLLTHSSPAATPPRSSSRCPGRTATRTWTYRLLCP